MNNTGKDPRQLLVVGHRWPEPEATAAGTRMLGLLEGFLGAGYRITFASAATPGTYAIPLEPLGIQTAAISINDSSFDAFLKSSDFDLVLFDRFMTEEQFGWRVRECLPQCTLVLDTEDLHSLRLSRKKAIEADRSWKVEGWTSDPLFYRELASMFRCDLSLIISRNELDLLLSQVPILRGKLLYLPFLMKPGQEERQPGFGARSGLVFVGTGLHRPNLDAIEQLKFRIWPKLSQSLPRAVLRIYGAYLPDRVLGWHNEAERFEVCGWAPHLEPVFQSARLQLAPIRYGAGIKGKVLHALRFGCPTMGSPVSMEGICTGSSAGGFTASAPDEFIQKAARLYQDEKAWEKAVDVLTADASPHFANSFDLLTNALDNLQEYMGEVPVDRQIIQRLLRDQAFDRLRYLSKWIEAKNAHH